ncbi:hypothetical protein Nepgr_004825 [Nepenthes gracilis]|uniref:Uncharacterized protein n=1 Tax=Nepenthes gracilis TaxID=150966 RepID=A0AAD3XFV2_NEPGR|nr:hypothetical protein Nepgr_004825 [Nepenthes gracilis]
MKHSQCCPLVPIPVGFCCLLSLELMTAPVIGRMNLLPNYTGKALIANWSEIHNVKLPGHLKSMSLNQPMTIPSHPDSGAFRELKITNSTVKLPPSSPEPTPSIVVDGRNSSTTPQGYQEGTSLSLPSIALQPVQPISKLMTILGPFQQVKTTVTNIIGANHKANSFRYFECHGQGYVKVVCVPLKHAGVSKLTRNLSPSSKAILLNGPTKFYQQMLAKALVHYFESKQLWILIKLAPTTPGSPWHADLPRQLGPPHHLSLVELYEPVKKSALLSCHLRTKPDIIISSFCQWASMMAESHGIIWR